MSTSPSLLFFLPRQAGALVAAVMQVERAVMVVVATRVRVVEVTNPNRRCIRSPSLVVVVRVGKVARHSTARAASVMVVVRGVVVVV